MKVDTMRSIDYWLGIPLCLLISLLRKFIPNRQCTPEKVLLIELSEMGSAILVDPAMRKLKNKLKAELFFVIFDKNKPSLQLLNTVEDKNIFTIREDGLFVLAWDSLRFLLWTRQQGIDTVIDLELFSRFTALLTSLCGADNRVGFYAFHNEGLYRGEMLTHKVAYNPHMHIAKNFIALVNALHATHPETPYSKTRVTDAEICLEKAELYQDEVTLIQKIIRDYFPEFKSGMDIPILINANSSDLLPQRCWDRKNYAQVACMILQAHPSALILLTGSDTEREGLRQLEREVNHPRCLNFAGAVKFRQLPALYKSSAFMLSNDSGPAHFAAVTEMLTFVLFGPETPALYGSLGATVPIYAGLACSPCVSATNHRKTACQDNVCLKVITPEQVFNTIQPALKQAFS